MEYFGPDEFKCKCGCGFDATDALKEKADKARGIAGIPFRVSSGARCPAHNKKEKGAPDSQHITGNAVDIRCTDSVSRFKIVRALILAGFTGIDCSHNTYVHGDIGHDPAMIFNYRGNLK